jgi:hypothetical protein
LRTQGIFQLGKTEDTMPPLQCDRKRLVQRLTSVEEIQMIAQPRGLRARCWNDGGRRARNECHVGRFAPSAVCTESSGLISIGIADAETGIAEDLDELPMAR